MKTRILLIFLVMMLVFVFISCRKNEVTNPAADITGKWQWLFSYSGGNPGSPGSLRNPQNTDTSVLLVFNSNKTWFKFQNNIKTDSGSYSTGHGTYLPSTISSYLYIYDSIIYKWTGSNKSSVDFYKLFQDTLVFSFGFRGIYMKSDPSEGYTKYYIKVN